MIRPVIIHQPPPRSRLLLAAFLLTFLPAAARAQGILSGELIGVVRDSLGQPLPGTDVAVTELGPSIIRWVTTDQDGAFRLRFLPAGVYDVVAEQLGYRPSRLARLSIGAGQRRYVAIRLATEAPPVAVIDTLVVGRPFPVAPEEFVQLTAPTRSVGERSLRFAHGQQLELEGLPAWLGAVATDGFLWTPPRHPLLDQTSVPHWPTSAFGRQDARATADVTWPTFGGSVVGASGSPSGPRGVRWLLEGGTASLTADSYDTSEGNPFSWLAGMDADIMVRRDTARLVAGFRLLSHARAVPPAIREDATGLSLATTAADSFGLALDDYRTALARSSTTATGFARLDWMLTSAHALSAMGFGSRTRVDAPDFGPGLGSGVGTELEAFDAAGTLHLTSRLGSRLGSEFRLGGGTSERNLSGTAPPLTLIVGSAHRLGADAQNASTRRSTLAISQALHLHLNDHDIKLGVMFDFVSHEIANGDLAEPRFAFGDTSAFASGTGLFESTGGLVSPASFAANRVGIFAQDRWHVIPGLALTAGVRTERLQLPLNGVRQNAEWLDRTGIDNAVYDRQWSQMSPRIGLEWDIASDGRMLLSAGAGASLGELDPAAFAELVQRDGSQQFLRAAGTGMAWPNEPAATTSGTLLTLAGPEWRAPRVQRGNVALRLSPSSAFILELGGNFRHTEFLLRRHDVNLLATPERHDQYGRPVYGTLVNLGGLLVTDSGPNRRIDTFDRVSALDADGYSSYWGLTASAAWRPNESMSLTLDYTLSRTRDNWLTGRYGGVAGQLTPFPDSLGNADWAEGTSDFDVPHRLAVGLSWRASRDQGFGIAVLYRFRSGYPFTAGFRSGIDANGDGSGYNDPAFVDDTLPGMADAVALWGCLDERQSGFARRNACREPGVHAVDLRASWTIGGRGRTRFELYADALNLIATDLSDPDRALLLVDPAAPLVDNPGAGTIAVPLTVNPQFGQKLTGRAGARILRVGARIGL